MARMLVPDEAITTWIDIAGEPVDQGGHQEHVHADRHGQHVRQDFGQEGWREHWSKEAYIVRQSSVPIERPETDLFAGLHVGPGSRSPSSPATGRRRRRSGRPCRRRPGGVGLGLVQDDVRPETGLGELGTAERELEGDAFHGRLGPGLVEHEVAEGVPDRLAVVDLHRRGVVGVVADDHVGPGVDDVVGLGLLSRERVVLVFRAPVREDDDDVGAILARGLDVGRDALVVIGALPGVSPSAW